MSVVIGELNKVSISGAAGGKWSGDVSVNNFERSCGTWKVRSCEDRSLVIFVHGARFTKFRNVGENVGGGTIGSERASAYEHSGQKTRKCPTSRNSSFFRTNGERAY